MGVLSLTSQLRRMSSVTGHCALIGRPWAGRPPSQQPYIKGSRESVSEPVCDRGKEGKREGEKEEREREGEKEEERE